MERIKTTWVPKRQQLLAEPTFVESFLQRPFFSLFTVSNLGLKFQKKALIESPIYNECKNIFIKNAKWSLYNTLIIGISIAIGTKVLHQFRAFALSAPKRKITFIFKYLITPPLLGKINYQLSMKKQKKYILQNIKQTQQFKLQYRLLLWSIKKDKQIKTQIKFSERQFQKIHGRKPQPNQIE